MQRSRQPLYNVPLLAYALKRKGLNEYRAALAAKIHPSTAYVAMAGNLKHIEKLRQFSDSLDVVWKHLFDLDLPESRYRQAVLNAKRN